MTIDPFDLVNLARSFGSEAVTTLVHLMHEAKSEQVRLSAAKEILSRGYGRASSAAIEAANVATRPVKAKLPAEPVRPSAPAPRAARDDAKRPLSMMAALKSGTVPIDGRPQPGRS